MPELRPFLAPSAILDADSPAVRARALSLSAGERDPLAIARRCFDWTRSTILHTSDHGLDPVTCTASEVLEHGTGFCYAKSHLLTALLRANGIPCGLGYQRLAVDDAGSQFCLHGLCVVWLADHGWYRIDPRGERADLPRAALSPPDEHLPFSPSLPGERDFAEVLPEPAAVVVAALRRHHTRARLLANLPDARELDHDPRASWWRARAARSDRSPAPVGANPQDIHAPRRPASEGGP